MTNTNHTPGPWEACYSKTNAFGGGNIRSDYHIDGTGALLFVAGGMFHDYTVNREEELANMHLAASAPELLEALENLVASIENVDFSRENPGVYDQIPWAQAEAAIAKAKGVTDE
jgi:hypothetical protein